ISQKPKRTEIIFTAKRQAIRRIRSSLFRLLTQNLTANFMQSGLMRIFHVKDKRHLCIASDYFLVKA
ncbi:hypothetical protein KI387_018756, partial [Taxus chinensis]